MPTKESDAYSFGMVVWEVISREVPWSGVANSRSLHVKVVVKNMRPDFPGGVDPVMKDAVTKCWAGGANNRLTFPEIKEIFPAVPRQG